MNMPNMNEAKKRTGSNKKIIRDDLSKLNKIGAGKTYFIKTYGCQMNVHDSEHISAILENMGYVLGIDIYNVDVVMLNTCAIRENVHNKVFGMLGRLKHLKETKDFIIGLCGCMPQEEEVAESIKLKYKFVDLMFGTHNINELPMLLENCINEQQLSVYSYEGNVIEGIPTKRDSKIKAWVNIMYGCDKFCTYCIVPYTRGAQRSRLKEDIIEEVKSLKDSGYQEVTLLGQNVNAYGKDLDNNYTMANLLGDVSKTNIPRIRFVTSHPWDFTDEMIEVIKQHSNIMPYIHLPLQSGSDKILKLMGRKYNKESYMVLFNKLKKEIKNVSITTDIIVGFPGETESDFNETLEIVNKCKYDLAYTFIFSARKGTPAFEMEDNVTLKEKQDRLKRLNSLIGKYSLEHNKKYLNKTVKVLIEGISEKNNEVMTGYTETQKLINVKCDKSNIGKIINVKIIAVKTWSLTGDITSVNEIS